MTTAMHQPIEAQLSGDLRDAILDQLRLRGLDDPAALAKALDLVPSSTGALLGRDNWPLRAAMSIVETLELPITVTVSSEPGTGS